MPEVIMAVLCSDHVVDSRTNQLSLINIIEEVQVKGDFPAVLGTPIWLVILWEKSDPSSAEPEAFKYRFPVQQPGDGELIDSPKEHTSTIEKLRLRTMTAMQGLPLHGDGKLEIIIQVEESGDWTEAKRVPLFVAHQVPGE